MSKTANGIQQSSFIVESKKSEEIKRKVIELANEQQTRQLKIQLEFERIADQQKKNKQIAFTESYKTFKEKEILGKKRLEKILQNKQTEILNNFIEYEKKEKKEEEKRLKVEYRRVNKSTGIKEKYIKKQAEIKKFKEGKSKEYDENNENYFAKDQERTLRKIEKEKLLKIKREITSHDHLERSQKATERLKSIENKVKEQKENLLNKIELKNSKV